MRTSCRQFLCSKSRNIRSIVSFRSYVLTSLLASTWDLVAKNLENLERRMENRMRRLYKTALIVVFAVVLSNCSGNPFADPISVTVTNAFSTIHSGAAPVTLTAMVAHDKHDAGLRWSLTLGNVSCSPACGTLAPSASPSLTAVYTPPASPPMNESATITVASVADSTKVYIFNFTIVAPPPPISVSITNKFKDQPVGGPQVTINATVTNDPANAGVTWTLTASGSNCSPACGTLTPSSPAPSFSATYLPPTTQPTGANASPTITATSVTDTTANDSFNFSIVSGAGLFIGQYAFLIRGYDVADSPMAMAGSFTSDGNGNITGGELDFNNGGGVTNVPSPIKGSYTTDSTFNNIIRGTITISSYTFPNSANNIILKFVLSADGTRGRIMEFDGSGYINSGTMLQQDPAALSAANPAGSYAFGLDSDAPVGGRTVENGQLVIAQGGAITGIVDQSKAGNAMPTYSATPIAAGSMATTPDASGRGTMSITVGTTTSMYAYYLVNAGQLDLIQIDPGHTFGTVQAGIARAQAQLTASSVNTAGPSTLQMTGMDSPHGTQNIGPDVIIGVMTITGATTSGTGIFGVTFDSNDLGIILTNHPAPGMVASFDPTTGRGVISVDGGFNTGFMDSAVFYLYDAGKGFIIDADPSTNTGITNNAFSGTFTTQTQNFALSGNLIAGSVGSATIDIPNFEAAFHVNGQTGAATAMGDLKSVPLGGVPNEAFTGSFLITNFPLGYGTAMLPAGVFTPTATAQQTPASFYMLGPNQFVLIGTQSGVYSGISFFDPE